MSHFFYKQDNVIAPSIIFIHDDDDPPTGYSLITDPAMVKEQHIKRFERLSKDGINFTFKYTTEVYLEIVNGTITSQQNFNFWNHIHPLFSQIRDGQWELAQNTNSNLTVSGIYDQTRKDLMQVDLDEYVDNNF